MAHNYKTASLFKRFLAYLIDTMLVAFIIGFYLFFRMGESETAVLTDQVKQSGTHDYSFFITLKGITSGTQPSIYIESFLRDHTLDALIGFLLLPMIYFVFFEGKWGGTIGKLITGIRVRRKDGGKINFKVAFTRHIGRLVSTIILMLGYALAFVDNKKQTLHDKIANTLVLKKESGIN